MLLYRNLMRIPFLTYFTYLYKFIIQGLQIQNGHIDMFYMTHSDELSC